MPAGFGGNNNGGFNGGLIMPPIRINRNMIFDQVVPAPALLPPIEPKKK